MMRATRRAAAWLTAGALLRGATVCAAPVLGNLAQPAQDLSVAVSYNQWQATSFRLAAGAGAWRVRSLTVRLAQQTANESFAFRIVGEAALRPAAGDLRVAFTTPSISGTGTRNLTFSAKNSPAPVLQPGQTYWLVAGTDRLDGNFTPSTGLCYWSYALTTLADAPPAAGWSFGPATASAGTLGSNWTPEVTTPFTFSLDAVPENAAMTLDRWRESHPGGPADNTSWLNADDDLNGQSGLMDFAFDRNPEHYPTPITDAAGRFGLEYSRWLDAPELAWETEMSTDLRTWQAAPAVETTIVFTGLFNQRVRVVLSGPPDYHYLRLRIRKL